MTAPRTVRPIRLRWVNREADDLALWRHQRGRLNSLSALALGPIAGVAAVVLAPDLSRPVAAALAAVVAVVVAVGVWRSPVGPVRRARRADPAADAEVSLELGPDGVRTTRAGTVSELGWSAFRGVVPSRHHLFLEISDASAVSIPRAAVGDESRVASLLEQVRAWREAARPDPAAARSEPPEPGRDTWVLRYRLLAEDYVPFSVAVHRATRGPPVLVALVLLSVLLLVASTEPWRQPDQGTLVLIAAFGALLLGLGAIQRGFGVPWLARRGLRRNPGRLPTGDVVVGFGPDGGWMRTSFGVSRFGWGDVRRVLSDADQVVVLFTERSGMPVPSRVFDPPTDQDRMVDQIEAWRVAARPSAPLPVGPASPRPPGPTDPFAPPSE